MMNPYLNPVILPQMSYPMNFSWGYPMNPNSSLNKKEEWFSHYYAITNKILFTNRHYIPIFMSVWLTFFTSKVIKYNNHFIRENAEPWIFKEIKRVYQWNGSHKASSYHLQTNQSLRLNLETSQPYILYPLWRPPSQTQCYRRWHEKTIQNLLLSSSSW